jgi:hypothetical protein
VDVDNPSLTFAFTRTGKDSNGTAVGSVDLAGSMTWTVTSGGAVKCTIEFVTPQTIGEIIYHNTPTGIKVTTKASGIKTVTKGSFFDCGLAEGPHAEATYVGTTNMTGKDTVGFAVSISVDP